MIARRAAVGGLILAVLIVAYLIVTSGGGSYDVKLSLADADGLRQGSPVAIAGQDVGNVAMTVQGGRVIITMKINKADGPLGRGATASIDSVNLLGQKRIEVTKGDVSQPLANGSTLPQRQVIVATDLDQVLDVLTPNVRARLAILIDEAGTAMAGRQADISQTLEEFPEDFSVLGSVISDVADNNHTLGDLVSTTNGFVSQLASQNTALENAIDVAGQSAATVASRRAALAATLGDAPATLTSLDGFLAKLQAATVPLGPAARDITATAPELQDALNQVSPFTTAAEPVLTQATSDAPELTSLATGATPILQRATPVIGNVATFTKDLEPYGDSGGILDKSTDNLLAVLQNWARAIQLRDGLSHVFRGEATVSPAEVSSLLDTLESNPVKGSALARLENEIKAGRSSNRAPSLSSGSGSHHSTSGSRSRGSSGTSSSSSNNASGGSSGAATAPAAATASSAGASTGSGASGSTPSPSNPLSSLLSYLLK